MKSFIIAAIVLATILCAIFLNCLYINNVKENMTNLISAAQRTDFENSEAVEQTVQNIADYWDQQKKKVSLSVSYNGIDKIDDGISVLRAACSGKNKDEYDKALSMLIEASDKIARLERISIENIL